ncbi:MAG TPA: hypothetical protein VIV12_30855 [Streptosporangiaceae bacterium]
MPEPALTEAEHKAMDLCSELARAVAAIIGDGNGVKAADFREMVLHVHALQNMILAQAAARAYPDRYRLLGQDWNTRA